MALKRFIKPPISATKQELLEAVEVAEKALAASVKREAAQKNTIATRTSEATDARGQASYWRTSFNDLSRSFNQTNTALSEQSAKARAADKRKARAEELLREARNERTKLSRALAKATAPPVLSDTQEEIIILARAMFPPALIEATQEIVTDRSMQDTLMHLMERRAELSSDEAMLFAGIGMNTVARKHFDQALDKHWTTGQTFSNLFYEKRVPEVVVGSGVHGAIWAAVRHRKTGVKPLVVDKHARAGGAFAVTSGPAFYLNSRNRPGPLSIPGDEYGALNVIPGAPLQPSELGGEEYLTNDALAWAVRATLLMHADVHTGVEVNDAQPSGETRSILSGDGTSCYAGNVAIATGLSNPRRVFSIQSDRYLSFQEFFERMDSPFPLKGMKRVAVIGAGDGGKTVIEALTGQGPTSPLTVPTLDYVSKIDWYGVKPDQRTRGEWEVCNRSRYKGIGRLLPNGNRPFRVMPLNEPGYADLGYDCVKIDGMPYDYVIDCSGYLMNSFLAGQPRYQETPEGQSLGIKADKVAVVGPGAQLATERYEGNVLGGVAENATSIWRYADRTARFAEAV